MLVDHGLDFRYDLEHLEQDEPAGSFSGLHPMELLNGDAHNITVLGQGKRFILWMLEKCEFYIQTYNR